MGRGAVTVYHSDSLTTVHHADCLDVLPTFANGEFDLVLTDPPYNFGKDFANDAQTPAEYEAWCRKWFSECRRVARRVVIFCGYGNPGMWFNIERPAGIAAWYKPGNLAGAGIFQFCWWEPILVYGTGRIGGGDVFRCSISKQSGLDGHPTPKPARLFCDILVRLKARSVLDPFLGSGTTLAAAKALGIRGVGIEVEERYCAMSAGRLLQTPLTP